MLSGSQTDDRARASVPGGLRLHAAAAALVVAVVAACGGGDDGGKPAAAVRSYLSALASNDGRKACDLLTLQTREAVAESAGSTDCPALVDQLNRFLGADAARLNDATTHLDSTSDDRAVVTISLDGHNVRVELERVDGKWRLATEDVATRLLGLRTK